MLNQDLHHIWWPSLRIWKPTRSKKISEYSQQEKDDGLALEILEGILEKKWIFLSEDVYGHRVYAIFKRSDWCMQWLKDLTLCQKKEKYRT